MHKENIYVGIDLHKRQFNYVMMKSDGTIIRSEKRSTACEDVADFASRLDTCHHVALEPLQNSFWFIRQLRPYAGAIHLANPGKVRLIAESRLKNDKIDARILADLLRVGYLPTVYIPDEEILQWRALVSHRIHLVRDRTRLKNRVLGQINREGYLIAASDAFGKKGRAELDGLPLPAWLRSQAQVGLTQIDYLMAEITALDRQIQEIVDSDPIATLLCTVDGVGPFIALVVRSSVGDISRFKSAKAFAAYTGLIPGYRNSADTNRNGPITKQGVTNLRWTLVQSVNHAIRHSDYLKRLYQRICFRSSVQKARVAVAHALARILYHVWMEARPYYR